MKETFRNGFDYIGNKKPTENVGFEVFYLSNSFKRFRKSGPDGTRTRDLIRDRDAF
jgi:hypothetical protein